MHLGAGLCLATPDTRRWQQVVAAGEPIGVAVRLDERDERVLLGLSFLDGSKVVDVSVDPASWVRCLQRAARALHEPHTRWADALETGLRRAGTDRGWWNQLPEQLEPELTATAAAWPLVRPAIVAGSEERAVPRWAVPLLSATNVTTGSRAVLGNRADRRVIREMANALSGPIRWWPIACAIALPQLDAGRVGDLLAQSTSTYRCTQDERYLLTSTLRRTHPDVVRRLLTSADVDGGPQRLLTALDGWKRLPTHDRHVPNRLDRLEREVLAELEVAPPPAVRPQREVVQRQRPARPPRRARPAPQPPIVIEEPPANNVGDRLQRHIEQVAATNRLSYDQPWIRLHHARRGPVELVLPNDAATVVQWGRALRNCLAIYEHAVAAHRIIIVGIRVDQRLVGAVEINTRQRAIGQLEGARNRPLEEQVEQHVRALINDLGVL